MPTRTGGPGQPGGGLAGEVPTRSKRKSPLAPTESLAPFRVGSVKALNTIPLTRGIEDQVIFARPTELAQMLRQDELDAGLVSIVEPLLTGRYDVLDGIAVASLGEVKSVVLAHRRPLEKADAIYCDPDSLSSVALLQVLLAERGLQPEFRLLEGDEPAGEKDFVLLIGDAALDFVFAEHEHEIFDLGAAWYELTQLPFVYAAWSLRRGTDNSRLKRILRAAKDFGMETLDDIIRSRPEYTLDFRKDYLGWHIHYYLGTDEKRGIAKFAELLEKHGLGPVHDLHFVT